MSKFACSKPKTSTLRESKRCRCELREKGKWREHGEKCHLLVHAPALHAGGSELEHLIAAFFRLLVCHRFRQVCAHYFGISRKRTVFLKRNIKQASIGYGHVRVAVASTGIYNDQHRSTDRQFWKTTIFVISITENTLCWLSLQSHGNWQNR